jgi:cyclic pyranopterin phosphate synthase
VIASVTEPFCSSCTRARLTADGKLVTCLFSDHGHDLKSLMRNGATDEQLIETITAVWSMRTDRYSDQRLAAMKSREGYQPKAHHKIEMITLGG